MTIAKTILGLLLVALVIGVIVAAIQIVYIIGVVIVIGAVAFVISAAIFESVGDWWRARRASR